LCFKYFVEEHVGKWYDDGNALRWNFEIKQFVAQWVVHIEENMCKLKLVKDHMLLWDVGGKGKCCYQLVLRLQKGRNVD
jgi:hypothetical protein